MENKETFQARLRPYFGPSDQLDIKLAYCLAKFGHRAQLRKEMVEGKPTRYFEHVRRVAIILMDELRIMDRDMIISALLHDSLEDTHDLTSELIEHCFGTEVIHLVKLLSKVPKEGYIDRLQSCYDWKVILLKFCDRMDNIRSLMIPENTREFQKKQLKETQEKYLPIFEQLLELAPVIYRAPISSLLKEMQRSVMQSSILIELMEKQAAETSYFAK